MLHRDLPDLRELGDAPFSLAFDHAAIGMALVSLEGRWLKVNRALCGLPGYSEVQQSYANVGGVQESLPVARLVEDALRMNTVAMTRHEITVLCEFDEVPPVVMEKHKVLQILVNLIRNAKHALTDSKCEAKCLTLRIARREPDHVAISVSDNGIGIARENMTRIFEHGYTTKPDGHGFGLHSGVLAAREMGGSLTVQSDGLGAGATFTLELPLRSNNSGHTSEKP
jgi:C4-dicarboxylate-specific signal transduction histidine kinase